MSEPFLSIIIPSFNQGAFIERTLLSVLSQSSSDFELIVMDAGSTDKTRDILERYRRDCAAVVCERDNGQADAINKGVRLARGHVVTWLNSDDLLLPQTVDAVRAWWRGMPEGRWLTGDTVWVDTEDRVLACGRGNRRMPLLACASRVWGVTGPSAFILRRVWEEIGGVDDSLHYNFDIDLWLKLLCGGYRYSRLRHYCWGFRVHEQSKTTAELAGALSGTSSVTGLPPRRLQERQIVATRYGFKNDAIGYKACKLGLLGQRMVDGSLLASRLETWRHRGKPVSALAGRR